MVEKKIFMEWVGKADEDFYFASACLDDEIEYFGHICFHFQQATEKYLKAFIISMGLPLKKIHNLLVLLDLCCQKDSAFENLRESCQDLNRFYVDTRYPAHWPTKFTRQDAQSARQSCETVGKLVKAKI